MNNPVSMNDVAAKLGCHQTTVSRALRNDPRIPETTRRRVQAAAKKMGYTPNPLVSALIETRRRKSSGNFTANIGYLTVQTMRGISPGSPLRVLFESAAARASELGFFLTELPILAQSMDVRQISRIMETRSIKGAIIAPTPPPHETIEFPWSVWPLVVIGHWLQHPKLYRVAANHYDSIITAALECQRIGYSRVGFCLETYDNERTNGYEIGGYAAFQLQVPRSRRIPPLVMDKTDFRQVAEWIRKFHPDVVMTSRPELLMKCFAEIGLRIPAEIGIVALGNGHRPFFARVERSHAEIGALSAEILVRMIHRNQKGIPEHAGNYLINSRWIWGKSLKVPEAGKVYLPASNCA